MSGRAIARDINRSKTVIYNFLENPKEYGKKSIQVGLPLLLCDRNVQLPVELA